MVTNGYLFVVHSFFSY